MKRSPSRSPWSRARACTSCAFWSTKSWSRSIDQALQPRYGHALAAGGRNREQRLSGRGATGARSPLEEMGGHVDRCGGRRARSHGGAGAIAFADPVSAPRGCRQPLPRAHQRDGAPGGGVQRASVERDRTALSHAALAGSTRHRRVAQGPGEGAQARVRHRPRQLHQRRRRDGSPRIQQPAGDHEHAVALVERELDNARCLAIANDMRGEADQLSARLLSKA